MNLQNFKQNIGFFAGIAMLSLLVSSLTVAQEGASVSGRVVNELGDPVVGISIAIQPYKVMGNRRQEGVVDFWQRHTDLEGRFSITKIAPESVRFVVDAEQTETKILSIEMGDLTLYPNDHPHFDKMRFSLEAGMEIENAVVTVKMDIRPQIRARVVFADGVPVTNAQIRTHMLRRDLDASGYGSSSGTKQTDADGYFVENLRVDDDPKFYVLGVEHQGLLAKVLPFILHEGQPQVHLLLTLNGNAVPLSERPAASITSATLTAFVNPPTVWVVNPVNGHAYKSIYCHSITDAMTQAAAENAYLIAINDQIEADWIREIFGNDRFWIGLSDVAEEGQWSWHSGEPVTYTNWEEHERDGGNTEIKDYVTVAHGDRWQTVAAGDNRGVVKAILEKTDVPVKTPSEGN